VLTQRARQLYDYRDLMSLLVAKELRDRGISTQHIRQVVNYLREQGYPSPSRKFGSRCWEGGCTSNTQTASGKLATACAANWSYRRCSVSSHCELACAAVKRAQDDGGKVEQRRGAMGSTPVFAGTRIPVKVVRNYLAHGFTVDQVIEAFPDLRSMQ